LADETPNALDILEERELLDALMSKLGELDPDGRRICELLMQDKSEREIAAIMGFTQQSTVNYKKKKAFETLRKHLRDYI
jgi:DNA-directed RNA polymerase specialized sigma subunit